MEFGMRHVATVGIGFFLLTAAIALLRDRPVVAGTLLVFVAFSIYLRETHT